MGTTRAPRHRVRKPRTHIHAVVLTTAIVIAIFGGALAVRTAPGGAPCPPSGVKFVNAPAVTDTTAPLVTLKSPGAGATVTGTVTVTACASDNGGVAGVQFKLDGANLGPEDT